MNKKHIILIVVVIAVIAVIGCYFLFNGGIDSSTNSTANQKTILLSKSAYMQVPDTKNVSDNVNKKGVHYYKNKHDDINITSCSNLSDSSSSDEIKKLKDDVVTGSKKSTEDNVVIYEKNGTYSIFVKNTQYNDTLFIQSSNKNLLLQCWESVKYHDPAQKIEINDTGSSGSVINVVEKTQDAVASSTQSSTSSSSSSQESSSSASSWGYDWSSGSSSSGSSSAGGSASSSSRFDFS